MLSVQRQLFVEHVYLFIFLWKTMTILFESEEFTLSSALTPKQNCGVHFDSNAQWCSSWRRVPPLL